MPCPFGYDKKSAGAAPASAPGTQVSIAPASAPAPAASLPASHPPASGGGVCPFGHGAK